MITVPAQIFCEPRAAFTAAARSMPGVCGVLLSSRSLLMTLTPSSRQSRSDFNNVPREVISDPRQYAAKNNRFHGDRHPYESMAGRAAVVDPGCAAHRRDGDGGGRFWLRRERTIRGHHRAESRR